MINLLPNTNCLQIEDAKLRLFFKFTISSFFSKR